MVAESAGLDGASGSVGTGVEEEHDGFTLEGGERDWISVFVGQSEVGSFLVDVHDHVSIPQNEAGRHAGDGDGGDFVRIAGTVPGAAAGEEYSARGGGAGDVQERIATAGSGDLLLREALLRCDLLSCDSGAVHAVFGDGVRGAAVRQGAGDVYGAERDGKSEPERRPDGDGLVRQWTLQSSSGCGDAGEEDTRRGRWWCEDPSKPVLHRRAGSEGDNPAAHPAPAASATDAGAVQAEDDPDRPRLHRREGSGGDSSASTQTPRAGWKRPDRGRFREDPDRPKLHRRDDSGGAAAAANPASTDSKSSATSGPTGAAAASPTAVAELTPSDDPEHPILRRGKPVQEQSGRDLPEFHPVGKPGGAMGNAMSEEVTRQVAVSDAGPSEAQSLIYRLPRRGAAADGSVGARAGRGRVAPGGGTARPRAAPANGRSAERQLRRKWRRARTKRQKAGAEAAQACRS